MTTNKRHLTSAALALAGALALTACGDDGGNDTAGTGTATHGGGHSSAASAPSATTEAAVQGNTADVAFLTGTKPHHEQAVEMSDMVLAADPPAPVAELARQVKAAQAPEIEQMDEMLADLVGTAGRPRTRRLRQSLGSAVHGALRRPPAAGTVPVRPPRTGARFMPAEAAAPDPGCSADQPGEGGSAARRLLPNRAG
jgi:uncharacterized protein (DUF305 family)